MLPKTVFKVLMWGVLGNTFIYAGVKFKNKMESRIKLRKKKLCRVKSKEDTVEYWKELNKMEWNQERKN